MRAGYDRTHVRATDDSLKADDLAIVVENYLLSVLLFLDLLLREGLRDVLDDIPALRTGGVRLAPGNDAREAEDMTLTPSNRVIMTPSNRVIKRRRHVCSKTRRNVVLSLPAV